MALRNEVGVALRLYAEFGRINPPLLPRPRQVIRLVGAITALSAILVAAEVWGLKPPPKTRTDNVKEVIHGVEVVDPYRWLEDRKSSETGAWIEAQNVYRQSILGSLPGRESLKQRLAELLRIDVWSVPIERNGRSFFLKRLAEQELPVLYVRKGSQVNDEVLIDPHTLSPDRSTSVTLLSASQEGTVLAYGVRKGGEDETTIRLLDVESRRDLPDHLPKGRYFGVSFRPDKSGFYYSRHGREGSRIYYHLMNTDASRDTEIFGEGYGPEKGIASSVSDDGRYLMINVFHGSAAEKTEIYYKDLAQGGPIVPVVNDLPARFLGDPAGDQLFMQTNWKAPNGRILAVDLNHPDRSRWKEVIPETDAVIDDFSLAGGQLLVSYLKNVRSSLKVFEADGRYVRDLALPGLGSISGLTGRWQSEHAFFGFTSFNVPRTIYHYAAKEGALDVWARPTVRMRNDQFEVKQVWVESKDRTKFPMFLMHPRDIKLNGSNPTLLYGYGGFNISETPAYSPRAVLWVERGGVFAVANLRGGGEFGEEWHRAGMGGKKQNVFDDFIAAAEWLVKNAYTQPSKLAITGRSNGGLLVGAALTQRPDLFQAVVCGYPLLDMVRYHKFLVAPLWVSEYGSSEDSEPFKYLLAYSPYHHVREGTQYPAVLFMTGDGDTRVDPLHARKMCARLQAATASNRPVLLHYDTQAGHTGVEPVSKQIDELTDEMGFLFSQLDLIPK